MFETLFTYSRVLRRHREGPLAQERAAYLAVLAAHSVAPATLLKQARCCLRVAVELERWPADHCFDIDEVGEMASRYSAQCRASSSRYAKEHFRSTAADFLRRLGPLRAGPEDPSRPIRDHAVRVHRPAARTELAVRRHLPVGEMAHREVPRRPRAEGFGPADSPTSRYRCVLPAHGGTVEPEFAEPFRQVRTRMVDRCNAGDISTPAPHKPALSRGETRVTGTRAVSRDPIAVQGEAKMNKNDLVSHVAAETSATRATAERMVGTVFSAIGDALARDEPVAIAGFGTFFTRTRAPRRGRNPRTGESLDIPASTTPARQ